MPRGVQLREASSVDDDRLPVHDRDGLMKLPPKELGPPCPLLSRLRIPDSAVMRRGVSVGVDVVACP